MTQWLERMERKYRRYAIPHLMNYIVMGMGLVFVMDYLLAPLTGFRLSGFCAFSRAAVTHGQVWRLLTFVFMPPDSSLLWIVFSLYFYWLIGSALENQWGAFKFNVYYLCGIVGAILSGFITGYSTNSYLNLSLFLAFALMFPDYEVLVFFILPVKMKYLALLSSLSIILSFVVGSLSTKVAIAFALLNVILFFGNDAIRSVKNAYRRYQWRKNFR